MQRIQIEERLPKVIWSIVIDYLSTADFKELIHSPFFRGLISQFFKPAYQYVAQEYKLASKGVETKEDYVTKLEGLYHTNIFPFRPKMTDEMTHNELSGFIRTDALVSQYPILAKEAEYFKTLSTMSTAFLKEEEKKEESEEESLDKKSVFKEMQTAHSLIRALCYFDPISASKYASDASLSDEYLTLLWLAAGAKLHFLIHRLREVSYCFPSQNILDDHFTSGNLDEFKTCLATPFGKLLGEQVDSDSKLISIYAANKNKIDYIEIFFQYLPHLIDEFDYKSRTALTMAMKSWNTEIVLRLLSLGASVNCRNSNGETLVEIELKKNNVIEAVDLLLFGARYDGYHKGMLEFALHFRYFWLVDILFKNAEKLGLKDKCFDVVIKQLDAKRSPSDTLAFISDFEQLLNFNIYTDEFFKLVLEQVQSQFGSELKDVSGEFKKILPSLANYRQKFQEAEIQIISSIQMLMPAAPLFAINSLNETQKACNRWHEFLGEVITALEKHLQLRLPADPCSASFRGALFSRFSDASVTPPCIRSWCKV